MRTASGVRRWPRSPRRRSLVCGPQAFQGLDGLGEQGVHTGRAVFQAAHMQHLAHQIELFPAQPTGLADAQAMAIQKQQKRVVALSMAPLLLRRRE